MFNEFRKIAMIYNNNNSVWLYHYLGYKNEISKNSQSAKNDADILGLLV